MAGRPFGWANREAIDMSETTASETARTAMEISREFKLGAEAGALLVEGMQPEPFLDALQAGNHFVDACRFLAHALPKRKAVMWACACLRQVLEPEAVEGDTALHFAERWTADPSEENRYAALAASETAEVGAPGGLAALAAGVSGGSLAPPGLPRVPPGDCETARTVSGVVLLAAVRSQPEKASEKFARFLEVGREISLGPYPPPPAPTMPAMPPQEQPSTSPAFNDTASIARGWSEAEPAEHEASGSSPVPPPPVAAPAAPAPAVPAPPAPRRNLRPKTLTPLSRPRREETPKDSKSTFNDNESIGKMSFEDE
jgi:hypothetical protein